MKYFSKHLFRFVGLLVLPLLWLGCGKANPQIGLQAWTYHHLTFFETVDKASMLGISNMEVFPGQKLGGGLDGKMGASMTPDERTKVKAKLKEAKVTLCSMGVVNAPDETQWRAIFDFAKEMGLQWITTEPPVDQLPLLDKLSKEYGIPLAIHNHGPPSPYADPAASRLVLDKYGDNIDLCADTGHWARAGHDPVAALRLFPGRIRTLHLKDVAEFKGGGKDVPFGTGVANLSGQLAVLREQGFKGIALIEYENNTPNLDQDVARCVEYMKLAATASEEELVEGKTVPPGTSATVDPLWADGRGKDSKKWNQPEELFKADLSNAEFTPGSWVFENGILSAKSGGEIWTKESYGNFALGVEFRCAEKTNSAVFLRCSDPANWLNNAIEVQILQGDEPDPKHVVGAIFDCLAPTRQVPIIPGQWHKYNITAKDNMITVVLDGEEILKMNLDDWTTAHKNPDGSPNKFEKAYKDMAREGRIGFQYHGFPIDFRNMHVEKLQN